jgi:hypothetical protein
MLLPQQLRPLQALLLPHPAASWTLAHLLKQPPRWLPPSGH